MLHGYAHPYIDWVSAVIMIILCVCIFWPVLRIAEASHLHIWSLKRCLVDIFCSFALEEEITLIHTHTGASSKQTNDAQTPRSMYVGVKKAPYIAVYEGSPTSFKAARKIRSQFWGEAIEWRGSHVLRILKASLVCRDTKTSCLKCYSLYIF